MNEWMGKKRSWDRVMWITGPIAFVGLMSAFISAFIRSFMESGFIPEVAPSAWESVYGLGGFVGINAAFLFLAGFLGWRLCKETDEDVVEGRR